MTTQIHDSTTCTAGANGGKCEMCQFASKSPSEPFQGYPKPSEGEKIDSSLPSAPRIAMSAPDFDREWREAPESHKRYTERPEAEWWLMRGVWLGIQYERERGLLAINGDLREMRRLARERIGQ